MYKIIGINLIQNIKSIMIFFKKFMQPYNQNINKKR